MSRSISKALRFAILERDRFTCRYCGRSAPEVVLHVDHVLPASRGGRDGESNLVTACSDCNLGKSDLTLTPEMVHERNYAVGARLLEIVWERWPDAITSDTVRGVLDFALMECDPDRLIELCEVSRSYDEAIGRFLRYAGLPEEWWIPRLELAGVL